MILIDENIPAQQISLLREWGIRVLVVGVEIARFGTTDENLLPQLHGLSRPTFCTLDGDFYQRHLCHKTYCLLYVDTAARFAAEHIRRFLKHPVFDSQAKRMGRVVRAHPAGLSCWRLHGEQEDFLLWHDT